MERVEFAKLVREGCERLPAAVREKIRNVAILIEDVPSEEVREREGLRTDETLLGYYHGVPLTGRDYANGPVFPDVITLFQRPIENAAREDGADVRDVIADTIWHEFAHHFGMDEDAVRARERKRK